MAKVTRGAGTAGIKSNGFLMQQIMKSKIKS